MKQGSFFSSVLYLFVIFLIAGEGLFFIGLRYFADVSEYLANLLLYKRESFVTIGVFFLAAAFFLLLSFYRIYRHRYISISSKNRSCLIDGNILTDYAKKYFEKLFNSDFIETEVFVFQKKIEIIAYLSSKKNNGQLDLAHFLEKSRKEFDTLLREKFGYTGKFIVTFKLT